MGGRREERRGGRRAERFRVGKLSASCGLARPHTAPFRTPARPSTNTKRPRGKARATKIRTTHLFQGADHFRCRSLRPQTIYLTIYLRAQTISIVHFRGCRPFPKWAFAIYNCPQTISTPFRHYIILYVRHSGVEIVCALSAPLYRGPAAKRGLHLASVDCVGTPLPLHCSKKLTSGRSPLPRGS